MSKFLQVLEQVERDHAAQRQQVKVAPKVVPDEVGRQTSARRLVALPTNSQSDLVQPKWPDRPEIKPAPELGEEVPAQIEPHLVSLLAPFTLEAERYRSLSHLLERMHQETGCSVVAVSSPSMGDGKTTTAVNLAGALAQTSAARVLLVEADLRRPTISRFLGLDPAPSRGLVDAIQASHLSLHDITQPCPQFKLTVLPAGRVSTACTDILNSPRLGSLFTEARHSYEYIIVDTPPMISLTDCRLIERWVDGFLVVVTAHKTPRKLVEEALAGMDQTKLIGLVFNGDDRPASEYYSSYAYGPSSKSSWMGRLGQRIKKVAVAL